MWNCICHVDMGRGHYAPTHPWTCAAHGVPHVRGLQGCKLQPATTSKSLHSAKATTQCAVEPPPHDNGRHCAVSPPIHTHTHTNCEIEHSLKYLSTMFTYMHHEWLSSMTGHASHGQLALFLRAMCCEGHHGELPPLCWVATYTHPHTYKL